MKISYAITIKDELIELDKLLHILYRHKRPEDEIVIVFDSNNGSESVQDYLRSRTVSESPFKWHSFNFEGHFADLKNFLTKQCSGDYIFQIDADEFPNPYLIKYLPEILQSNQDIEVYLVPRINTVEGLTEEHIKKWRWHVNKLGWVNWPDYQWRVWKNKPEIRWINKVHERLEGFKTYALIPADENMVLHHPKTILRQERQNAYYDTL